MYIMENSKIYGRQGNKTLSTYQKEINNTTMNVCLENPSVLSDRKVLLDKARQVTYANGYVYKKGMSCSHRSQDANVKHLKLNKEVRLSRIEEITDKLKDVTDQIGFKEKRQESANIHHQYKECDKLTEQIIIISENRKTKTRS